MVDLGRDFDRNWIFENGDLKIVEDTGNIVQSIYNRLMTYLDSMDLFYDEYGSKIQDFLGWGRNNETLSFINLELGNALSQDPRCQNNEVRSYFKDNTLKSEIIIHLPSGGYLAFNMVLNDDYSISILENDMEVDIL